jgi:hypothetical protein
VNWLLHGLVRRAGCSEINRRNTHVEAETEESQDAGSIPAASIFNSHLRFSQVAVFTGGYGDFWLTFSTSIRRNHAYFVDF